MNSKGSHQNKGFECFWNCLHKLPSHPPQILQRFFFLPSAIFKLAYFTASLLILTITNVSFLKDTYQCAGLEEISPIDLICIFIFTIVLKEKSITLKTKHVDNILTVISISIPQLSPCIHSLLFLEQNFIKLQVTI